MQVSRVDAVEARGPQPLRDAAGAQPGAPSLSRQEPHDTIAPAARSVPARASRVVPTPGSPVSSTTPPARL